ncbi:peptidoglycan-binding domain-containing protein [Magnetospirillum aberrantis]|uniref:Peptidoglycan-binding protein n=1 Tax=Magnetospirillum aberrantis SpK TaxID=908842 RepID=A0A7C9QVY3_9PROT|nr:peptidoglycan-binding domain-containing protein [Magnetospirillum aberrantis]NFV81885.1 peptidoglycan-binding protein [Magnetospirillum aberrantis SpK]
MTTRADVAKVQTLLGKAGYLDLGQDGPSGYANPNTDKAIRDFQKENGLQVDGVLKPGGPTIAKLGGLLGGGTQANSFMPRRAPFDEKPDVPDIRTPPTFPQQQPNGTRKPADLLSILLGEAPEPTIWSPQSTPRDKPQGGRWTSN